MTQAAYGAAKRLGILGGTFNPIHVGHITMAEQCLARYALDAVLLIPANNPPHKHMDAPVSCADRLEMTRLAIGGSPGLFAGDMECRRPGKSYTVETLECLQASMPQAHLHVIVGSDMLRDLPGWHRAEELLRMATFIGVTRQAQDGGEQEAAAMLAARYGADVSLATLQVPALSSTDLRRRLRLALPVTGLLPPPVEAYIYLHGLYLPAPLASMHHAVRTLLSPARFAHTAGVMQSAIWLADRYGVSAQKARLAALLHDCGRGEDNGPLTHAETGARIARERFGVCDKAVLQAIRLHTTLAPGATTLDQIIYLADMIEPGRDYPGVDTLRALAAQDLRAAMRMALAQAIAHVQQRGETAHPNSLRALENL